MASRAANADKTLPEQARTRKSPYMLRKRASLKRRAEYK